MKRENLINARRKAKKTQAEIAKNLGLSERQYQRIESGDQRPNLDTAFKLSDMFKLTVEKLFK